MATGGAGVDGFAEALADGAGVALPLAVDVTLGPGVADCEGFEVPASLAPFDPRTAARTMPPTTTAAITPAAMPLLRLPQRPTAEPGAASGAGEPGSSVDISAPERLWVLSGEAKHYSASGVYPALRGVAGNEGTTRLGLSSRR
jgi:hypothetical protein